MPITKSAKKKLKQDKKRQKTNLLIINAVKESIKAFQKNPNKKNLNLAFSLLDKAKKKKIWHLNKVARFKSRLSLQFLKTKSSKKEGKEQKKSLK